MRKTPVKKRRVISEETSKKVRYALESVVAKGSGKNAYVDSYRVGGKTGTAQKAQNGRYLENNHIVSFIGFAPADDPQIVVYVAVDNPKGTIQFGGTVAAPIVGKIMDDSLQAMNVKPRKNQIEKKRQWNDPKEIKIPNLEGMTKKELLEQRYPLQFDVSGNGNKVVNQSPKPGTKVEEGATVRIFMN